MNNALFDLDNYKPVPVVYQMRAAILKRVRENKDRACNKLKKNT